MFGLFEEHKYQVYTEDFVDRVKEFVGDGDQALVRDLIWNFSGHARGFEQLLADPKFHASANPAAHAKLAGLYREYQVLTELHSAKLALEQAAREAPHVLVG